VIAARPRCTPARIALGCGPDGVDARGGGGDPGTGPSRRWPPSSTAAGQPGAGACCARACCRVTSTPAATAAGLPPRSTTSSHEPRGARTTSGISSRHADGAIGAKAPGGAVQSRRARGGHPARVAFLSLGCESSGTRGSGRHGARDGAGGPADHRQPAQGSRIAGRRAAADRPGAALAQRLVHRRRCAARRRPGGRAGWTA
jgi:hypothetical protein